ncbi:DNA repair protein rad10 subfamily protein [Toxoplasma gondii TgCatPRC2]|uniref:DNA repair protein rad10 subfamily protein n=1 Tax=Toxoplasma gondii TgCatPRC2 TaxID=1130821 RepID=A0A151H000_TOXGO|nr:DNA repair protein rad10 subfamily protein [Toxoplasma gondii TgCatPRC2]
MLKMAETPSASLKRAARARGSTAREQVARVSESMNIPEKQNEPHGASTCGKRVANREEELKSQAAPEQQRSAKHPFPSFTPASCLPSPISSTLASSSSSTLASSSSSSPSSTLASSSSSTLASSSSSSSLASSSSSSPSSTLASSSSSSSGAEGRATVPPPFTHERAGSLLVISLRQKGNPLLKFITAVPHTFAYIAPDFLVGPSACVLFLSLRYHQLFPSYLSKRIEDLADGRYTHKFLLLHVDLEVPDAALAQVTLLAFHHCFSLLLGTCLQECAGVLQLLKAYEKKPADTLLAKLDAKHCNRVLGTQVLKNRKYLGSREGEQDAVGRNFAKTCSTCDLGKSVNRKSTVDSLTSPKNHHTSGRHLCPSRIFEEKRLRTKRVWTRSAQKSCTCTLQPKLHAGAALPLDMFFGDSSTSPGSRACS